jgi:hypothetical protein
MKASVKIPVLLIAAGCLTALCPLFFLHGYKSGAGFFTNIMAVKVWLIPYRFILALGVLLIFAGIKKMADGR